MAENEYDIQKLEKLSGISVRNIRYYTEQELLNGPATYHNKQAFYTDEHLKRLKLIKRFRDWRYSLESIKGILSQMKESDIDSLLTAQDKVSNLSIQPSPAPIMHVFENDRQMETVDYIDHLMSNQPELTLPEGPKIQGESWVRISLAPGIELHVHQPIDQADSEKINVLIGNARDLFRKRKRGG